MNRASFTYGDERYEYEVCCVPQRQAKIAIHVHPDASVQVDAPKGARPERIHKAVLKRARWISNHVTRAREQRAHALPRLYVSGESHFYLGRRYQLKLVGQREQYPSVKLYRGRIVLESDDREPATIKRLLTRWYRERGKEIFPQRVDEAAGRLSWLTFVPPLKLLTMRKQWGSCSPDGAIYLNPHLIKAPRDCIQYVIFHELCHLREHNHSPRYYRLLREAMPSWEPAKAKLDGMAELLLNE